MEKLKIGVVGAGHLGKIHLKLLLELKDQFDVVGFYDFDAETRTSVANQFHVTAFDNFDKLLENVTCIDIVTPTPSHFVYAKQAVQLGKAVFIEKPMTQTMDEALELIELTKKHNSLVQIGHVERFNAAFQSAIPYFNQPLFIESHRLSQYNPRGTDVPVVLDLMIHDIDIVLKVVNSPLKTVSASGVSIVTDTHDIANARLEFENGCVANLTASRLSMKNMRKSRFFQKDAYISVDFLNKELEVVRLEKVAGEVDPFDLILQVGKRQEPRRMIIEKPILGESNAIRDELLAFAKSIHFDLPPIVSVQDGFKAIEVAYAILDKMTTVPQFDDFQ